MELDEMCVGCACEIKTSVSKCRKLYSPSTCHVLSVMTRMFRELYNSEDVEKVLPSVESDRSKENIYVCIRCFRALDKLLKLESEKIKWRCLLIKSGFVKVRQCVELQLKSEVTPTRRRKRWMETTTSSSYTKEALRTRHTNTQHNTTNSCSRSLFLYL